MKVPTTDFCHFVEFFNFISIIIFIVTTSSANNVFVLSLGVNFLKRDICIQYYLL